MRVLDNPSKITTVKDYFQEKKKKKKRQCFLRKGLKEKKAKVEDIKKGQKKKKNKTGSKRLESLNKKRLNPGSDE